MLACIGLQQYHNLDSKREMGLLFLPEILTFPQINNIKSFYIKHINCHNKQKIIFIIIERTLQRINGLGLFFRFSPTRNC